MKPFLRQQLERYRERLAELDFLLAQPDVMQDMGKFLPLSREHTDVAAVAGRYARHQQREADLGAAREMQADPEMADLVADEIPAATAEIEALETELQRMLLPKDPDDARPAFLEIRAGTGGDESALFAGDLLRMYTRYAATQGWRVEVMSAAESELGGYKEVVLRVAGDNVYGKLRYESGGHRVQRVPATEAQGRIHTSACTVAVMPEPDESEPITLNPADLRIDTFRASGAGGQHINKTDSAVRVVHLPTGIVAECQDGRSQHANKAQALRVLQARLQEKERSERAAKEAATRKGLIGSGDRSDRIRTYNFPQGRLTDHRINLTLYKLALIMEGDLDDVIEALLHAREAEQLEELEIGHLQDRAFGEMSTGEQRRFLLGRALVHDPELLVLDEPTSGLDLHACFHYLSTIRRLMSKGKTILLVTHHIHEIPPEMSRVVLLKRGAVRADGAKEQILTAERLTALFDTPVHLAQANGWYQTLPG